MSEYYNPKKTWGIYDPKSQQPFRLSRSKIDLFLSCPRCFYMDRRLGLSQPPGYPFTLNSAVDGLLKKEFDAHRTKNRAHPLMEHYGVDAVPFAHPKMDEWRDAFKRGITFLHKETNFIICGGIDDIWVKPDGEIIIVDYKATAKSGEVNLDAEWQIGYKRQMEVYMWLFRQNGFKVSDTGYFVYCNGNMDAEAFDSRLEFKIKLIPYTGDPSWVEATVIAAKKCLSQEMPPKSNPNCDFCLYRAAASTIETPVKFEPVKKIRKAPMPQGATLFE
jgi:CRISPR/Cas system-associated exonuclease Cas4 (RecB family)